MSALSDELENDIRAIVRDELSKAPPPLVIDDRTYLVAGQTPQVLRLVPVLGTGGPNNDLFSLRICTKDADGNWQGVQDIFVNTAAKNLGVI